ncbi:hypothetical protein QTP88_007327 [Uroleucon formosanum]
MLLRTVLRLSPTDMDQKILRTRRAAIRSDFIRYYRCGRRPLAFPCIGGRSIDGVHGHCGLPTWFSRCRRSFSCSAYATTLRITTDCDTNSRQSSRLASTPGKTIWCEYRKLHSIAAGRIVYRGPTPAERATPVPFQIEKIFRLLLKISVEGSTQRSLENTIFLNCLIIWSGF